MATLDDILNSSSKGNNTPATQPVQQQPQPQAQPQAQPSASDNKDNYTIVSPDGNPDNGILASTIKADTGTDYDGAEKSAAKRKLNYDYILQQLDDASKAYKTPDEDEKAKKREKREKVISALGDGLSALSSLYYTTKGAPVTYDPQNSLSEAARKRYDKIKEDRDRNRQTYLDYQLKKADVMHSQADDEADEREQKLKAISAARQAEQQAEQQQWKHDLIGAQTDKESTAAVVNAEKAQQLHKQNAWIDKKAKSEVEKNKASANNSNSAAREHNVRAAHVGDGKGKSKDKGDGGKYTLNIGGSTYRYASQADYERAVMKEAGRYHIPTSQNSGGVRTSHGIVGGKNTNRKVSQIAADVETKSYPRRHATKHAAKGYAGMKI